MDVEESSATVAEINTGIRKRTRRKRRAAVLRENRHRDIDPLILNAAEPCNCKHGEKSKFKCRKISLNAIVRHRQRFFNVRNKVHQDIFLTRFVAPYEPERRKRKSKDLRKKPVIIHKEEYYQIYQKHGEVKKLGEGWKTLDIKSLEEHYKKLDGMRDIKRVVLKKHLVTKKIGRRVETIIKYLVNTYKNFRNESDEERRPVCLLKRGKRHPTELLQKKYCKGLSVAKKQDVDNLMKKQFGDNWRINEEFRWYKNLLENENLNQHEDDEENTCDGIEEETSNILV